MPRSASPSGAVLVNQQLIADQLGISRTTVSRCFTNHPAINARTRGQVFALAAKLGYSHAEKQNGAHAERLPARLDIGVLVCVDLPNFEHTRYGNPGQEVLNGLSEFARAFNAKLDLHFVKPRDLHLDSPSYATIFARRPRWHGVVLVYPFPRTVVDELVLRYPCVSLSEQYGGTALNCVDVDHFRGVGKIIDELLGLGHERIGFFTWRYPAEASWALHRHSAYVGKLMAAGRTIRPDDVINVNPRAAMSVEQAHAHAARQTKQGVTAWVCAADHQAYELLAFLKQRGIRVPQDVSVTGFDGIAQPRGAPKLSTVQIPYHQIGLTGGKRLFEILRKRFEPVQHVLLDCELRPGETIAARRPHRSRRD